MTSRYLSLREAAEIARVSTSTVRWWIRTAGLRAFKPGRRVLLAESDLHAFITAPNQREPHPKKRAPRLAGHGAQESGNANAEVEFKT